MIYFYFCSLKNTVIVAQLVRASDCGSEGRGFETHHSPKCLSGCPERRFCFLIYFQIFNEEDGFRS